MNYDQEARYQNLLLEQAMAKQKLKNFAESLSALDKQVAMEGAGHWVTKNESVDPFEAIERARQIRALQEADAEAIKKAGINFSGLIKKMVDKFISFSQQQITKTKPYLTNMKQQILAKLQGEDVPIEMRDYTTGVNRIKNFKLPPLESIKGKFKDITNLDTVEQQMRHELLPDYKDDSIDFGTYAQAYFLGGEKKLNTNINALDMQNIFDYCDHYDAIYKEIEADGRSLERLSQDSAKAANDAQAVENQAKADANAQGKTAQNNPSAQNASANLWTMGQNIIESINMIINEDETNQAGTAKTNAPNGQTGTNPQGGSKPDDGKMVIKPNESNPADAKNAVNANDVTPKQEVNGELNLINAYKKVGHRLLAAEMKAAGTIYKDYITIMKVHAPENGNNPVQQAAKDQEKKEQENNQNNNQQAQPQK